MALQESNDIVFMYVFDAKICERINYPTNKSITRKIEKISDTGVKTYQDIHERHYGFIEGMLIDIQLKTFENQNDKIWNFWLQDGLEKYCLKLRYSSRESKRLLSYLPNADLNHFIRIVVFREKDSTGTALLVNQRGKYLKSAFTKNAPNGLPQMVKTFNDKGKEVWDDKEQMEFYEKLVSDTINPTLHRLHGVPPRMRTAEQATATSSQTTNRPPSTAPVSEGGDDDLPF